MPKIPPPVADEPTSYLIWVVPLAICLLLFLIFIVVVAVVIIRRRLGNEFDYFLPIFCGY